MMSSDKTLVQLSELGDPGRRRSRPELLGDALRTALALTDADAAAVVIPGTRRNERLVLHAGSAMPAVLAAPPQDSTVARTLAECGQPLALGDLSDDARIAASDACPGVEAGPVLFTALRQRDPAPAYIATYRRRGRARFSAADMRMMLLLSAWLGAVLEGLRLASGVEKVAITDDLTEIYNARFLKTALKRELRRAGRFGQELSVVLIEIDQLDTFEEEHGELRTSVLLRDMASLLAQQVRSFDLLARSGETQFMLVLPQTGSDGATLVAERIRTAVEGRAFAPATTGAVTVSLGVAAFPQAGADAQALVATARRALVQAQQRGRNCVESAISRAA